MLQTPSITSTRALTSTARAGRGRICRVLLTASTPAESCHRTFHTTPQRRLKEIFPSHDTPAIRITRPAWPHPIYTEEQMTAIVVAHRKAKTWSDWTALAAVRTLRWGLDLATGYRHDKHNAHVGAGGEGRKKPFAMTERKYMIRNIFLESVAGVPGMVGGMLRHLHSMRRMKRDHGWMETLLEESYNERMHLLTFLQLAQPGPVLRAFVLAAQGVFFNAFFLAYLVSPRTCHRFVGYLEEEAVLTYTREIADIDAGKLPLWGGGDGKGARMRAPDLAVDYWKMPEGRRSMRDLLLYIRADEAKHREVNHTLGNLDQREDPNPFVSEYRDPGRPHPSKGIESLRSTGWERDEVI